MPVSHVPELLVIYIQQSRFSPFFAGNITALIASDGNIQKGLSFMQCRDMINNKKRLNSIENYVK